MRLLWTVVKVVVVLALLIPASFIVLTTALGVFGALVGLAFMALRLAVVGLVVYGGYRLLKALFGGSSEPAPPRELTAAERPDPYYEAAMRDLDRDMA
jgi:hypothetical protein